MKPSLLVSIVAIIACVALHLLTFQRHFIGWSQISDADNFTLAASDGKLFVAVPHRLFVPALTKNGSIVTRPLFRIEGFGITRLIHASTTGPIWRGFAIPVFTLALVPGCLIVLDFAQKPAPNKAAISSPIPLRVD